ncbi:MAG: hypothetical protein ACK41T_13370 [Pseudobdellovibrio sp.]
MSGKQLTLKDLKDLDKNTLDSIARRAHYLATQMIFQANNRTDKAKGDPKLADINLHLHLLSILWVHCIYL